MYNISIPQGSIKRNRHLENIKLIIKFQFHKVRLKDEVNEIISRTAKQISIPQGSIKSFQRDGKRKKYDRFQFHKVRLKGWLRQATAAETLTFQFHKVRLKGKRPL